MEINLIGFNTTLGKKKPENIINKTAPCPFCDRENLSGIVDTDGDLVLLKNKYNVIEDADQFVLIESKVCHSDMPDYSACITGRRCKIRESTRPSSSSRISVPSRAVRCVTPTCRSSASTRSTKT